MLSKPKSLFSQYQEESFGRTTFEEPSGFITFEIKEEVCIIIDAFIIKEARRTGSFYRLCNQVREFAKEKGCSKVISWIHLTNKTAHLSLRAQMALGMRVVEAHQNVLRLELSW